MKKDYISAEALLNDAFELAISIAESGFKPKLVVGVWRGGTPVAIAIHEALEFIGINSDHIAIRTSSYSGIGERSKGSKVSVTGLEYIGENLSSNDSLLIVDDVFDTGLSLQRVIEELGIIFSDNVPEIKIATPYYKPGNNQTSHQPDFYLHKTSSWLVFPHELQGLSNQEILVEKPGNSALKQRLLNLRQH